MDYQIEGRGTYIALKGEWLSGMNYAILSRRRIPNPESRLGLAIKQPCQHRLT
jgi:hypothetical protein